MVDTVSMGCDEVQAANPPKDALRREALFGALMDVEVDGESGQYGVGDEGGIDLGHLPLFHRALQQRLDGLVQRCVEGVMEDGRMALGVPGLARRAEELGVLFQEGHVAREYVIELGECGRGWRTG